MELVTVQFSPYTQQFEEWAKQNPYYDPRVMLYPTTSILEARTKQKTIAYLVTQQPVFMEPLILNPSADKHEIAVALRELTVVTRVLAQKQGSGEIFFVTSSEPMKQFADKHGMEKMTDTIYTMESLYDGQK